MTRLSLVPFFLHIEQALALLGPQRAQMALVEADGRWPALPSTAAFVICEYLAGALADVPELGRAWHDGSLRVGDLVGVQQAFYFRRAKERDREGDYPIDFKAKLNSDTSVLVTGSLNSLRCPTSSGPGNLSRRQSVYIIGAVRAIAGKHVTLHPVFAGIRAVFETKEAAVRLNARPTCLPKPDRPVRRRGRSASTSRRYSASADDARGERQGRPGRDSG